MGIFTIIFISLFGLQALDYYTFVKYLKTTKFYKPSLRWYALIPFLVFNVASVLVMVIFGRRFTPPDWFVIFGMFPFYVWQAATFFIGLWLLIGKIIKLPFLISTWLLKLIKPVKTWFEKIKTRRAVQVVDTSRRKFLRTATFAISSYAFAGAAYGIIRHDAFKIDKQQIKIANLPHELKGLTITLLSDIHAGQFMQEEEMHDYANIVNDLSSDLIIIPGDFVNFDPLESKSVARAFRDLKAKYGVYGSLGNHDFFVNPDLVASVMDNESPVRMLRNKHDKITINGKDL